MSPIYHYYLAIMICNPAAPSYFFNECISVMKVDSKERCWLKRYWNCYMQTLV